MSLALAPAGRLMNRALVLLLALVAAAVLVDVRPASAGLSRRNPYRSFNISGYNYASTHWELAHGDKTWSAKQKSGHFFRRR
jgi:hypothetical protein